MPELGNIQPAPRKRGRPRKNPLPEKPPEKKRRGRPPKVSKEKPAKRSLKKAAKKAPKKTAAPKEKPEGKPLHGFGDTHVSAKLFLNHKAVSKQLPWVDNWKRRYYEAISHESHEEILSLIDELNTGANKLIKEKEGEMFLHIPKWVVSCDGKPVSVIFDPVSKGADCKIYYKGNSVPLGMSPALKATTVANKFTDLVKSFIPIGACS